MAGLILIVEDEKIQAESMSIYLDRLGYGTVFTLSGEEGLRRAEEASPDIAIVDLRLPGMGGLDVLSRLREITPGSEVIMLTAHATVGPASCEARSRSRDRAWVIRVMWSGLVLASRAGQQARRVTPRSPREVGACEPEPPARSCE